MDSTGTDFSTLVLSANVLETFFATSIKTINNRAKPLVIDPLTYIFGLESIDLSPKRWYAKLVSEYGLNLILPVGETTIPIDRLITSSGPTTYLGNFVENVLDYQRERILMSAEYSDFLDVETFQGHDVNSALFTPRFLIPPYFFIGYEIEDISDIAQSEWLKVNLECARHAIATKQSGELICPVLLISRSLLFFPDQIKNLVERYGATGVDAFILWVADFRENRAPGKALEGFIRLVAMLAELGKPVYNFYGGMFSLFLSMIGMTGVCHSICYGESKDPFAEGGMLATVRYYDQDMKIKVPYGKLAEFLKLTNRTNCDCQYCVNLRTITGDSKTARGKRIEFAAKHFLLQRSSEIVALNSGEGARLVSDLQQKYELCRQNDITSTYSDFYKHLEIWSALLRTAA